MTGAAVPPPLVLAVVGAGPRAAGLLERLVANAGLATEEVRRRGLHVHLVDPHPAGAGRVWRHDQSPLLRMNSMAADVTMFTDASFTGAGPVAEGPTLADWARTADPATLTDPDTARDVATLGPRDFPVRRVRRVQHEYLTWFRAHTVESAPSWVTVTVHRDRVLAVRDRPDGRQGPRPRRGRRPAGRRPGRGGALTPASQVAGVDGWWTGFFNACASGPPGHRLEELLALVDAGLVHLLGPDLRLDVADWVFRARTTVGDVRARVLVEARLPGRLGVHGPEPLLPGMHAAGDASEEVLGGITPTGRLATTPAGHVVLPDGSAHPRRFAAGAFTSERAVAAFARPHTDAVAFRQSDALARTLLAAL